MLTIVEMVGVVRFERTCDAVFRTADMPGFSTRPKEWRKVEESNPTVLPVPGFQDQSATIHRHFPNMAESRRVELRPPFLVLLR